MRVSVFILTTVFLSNDPLGSAFAQHSMGRMMSNVEAEKEARVAIEALIGQEDAAWNKGDAAAFSARVLPQVVFTNVAGSFSVGREPFELQHAKIFATIYRGSILRQSIVQLSFIRPDVVIVDTVAEVSGFHSLPPGSAAVDEVLRTRLEQVLARNDNQWWVASFHNVAIKLSIHASTVPPR